MAEGISPIQRMSGYDVPPTAVSNDTNVQQAILNATISPDQSSRVEGKIDKPFIQVLREVGMEKGGQGTIALVTKFGNIGGQQVNYLNTDGISKDLNQQPFVKFDIAEVNSRNPVSRQLPANYVGTNVKTEA